MAIDYFIQYPCKVRIAITEAELLRMVKSRARATAMRDALRRDPRTDKNIPESDWKVVVRTMGPNGPSNTSVTISDLLKDSAPIERTWKRSFFSRVRVKSSQLLQMLVGAGSLDAARALLGADLLGFTKLETAKDDSVTTPQHDERTQEFTHFLTAAAFAGSHGVALLVDA